MELLSNPFFSVAGLFVGLALGYFVQKWIAVRKKEGVEKKVEEALKSARQEADKITISAKEKATDIIEVAHKEEKERTRLIDQREERVHSKEDKADKERTLAEEEKKRYEAEREVIKKKEEEMQVAKEGVMRELERISGLTVEEAREKLHNEMRESSREETEGMLARLEKDKKEEVEKRSAGIITTALQRYARSSVADVSTSVVHLDDENLKGKIIGREGRNVKAFERLTGVEVIVDESPDSILLSSFDPLRREIARTALQKLIKDGRIQPAKIEEMVEEAKAELDDAIMKAGEDAVYEVGVLDLPKEIVKVLGRLNYRTSYGQNVLLHSIEMTHIAGMIATELGLDVDIAKKGALVHDIGKAIDHEVEGTHVDIGRKMLKKYGVDERVIRAMEAHHDEYPYAIPEAFVVAAADAISGARPGARRDTLEKYIKRLEDIERVAEGFDGVSRVYAISGGRQVIVFVVPEKIDDFGALQLAKDVAGKIQSEIHYPGEIKVTVIREVKAVEYAK
jgi:ribonucrease Y